MEGELIKMERSTQSWKKTFHLYQDGNEYFLRRELYKSKNQKMLVLSDDFELELNNFKIHLPSPCKGVINRYHLWIPALNFVFNEGNVYPGGISVEYANIWLCGKDFYRMYGDNVGDYVKNYIRKVNLQSILD